MRRKEHSSAPANMITEGRGEGWNKNVSLYKSRALDLTLDGLLNDWEVSVEDYYAKPTKTIEELYQYQFQKEFKAKKIEGPILCYGSNGILFFKGNYNRDTGRLDGEWEEYLDQGQLCIRENWKDGNRRAIYESFYDNGQLMTKDNWVEGELNGLQERYLGNGKLHFRNNFKDDKPHGLSETFHVNNGYLASRGYFERGEKVGLWNFFSGVGKDKLTGTEKFKSNIIETFDSEGNLTQREYLKLGVTEYWQEGELVDEIDSFADISDDELPF